MEIAGVMHAAPPALSPEQAADVLRSAYGLAGTARPLVSERDQNFEVRTDDGRSLVLKVSNPAEASAVVEMEVAAVEHVAAIDPSLPVPRAQPTLEGALVGSAAIGGVGHLVRLLPMLPGRTVAPDELDFAAIRRIGVATGRLSHALRGFFHSAAGRAIEWDQKQLPGLMPHAELVTDPERRRLLEAVLARFRERALPALPTLRSQLIHNDVTLDNLLIGAGGEVSGVIDFGDMAHTALVLDVPATLQSLVRNRTDIFDVSGAFLAGYTSVVPLERREAELLGDLLAGRMAQTILISAWRTRRYPDNAYITGWEEPAWELLRQMEATGFDEAGERLAALAMAPSVGRDGMFAAHRGPCCSDGAGCWAPPWRRSPTGGRCTWCEAAGRGCTTPKGAPSWMPTTTCRWWATSTRGWLTRSLDRRPRSTRTRATCTARSSSSPSA